LSKGRREGAGNPKGGFHEGQLKDKAKTESKKKKRILGQKGKGGMGTLSKNRIDPGGKKALKKPATSPKGKGEEDVPTKERGGEELLLGGAE